MTFEATGYNDLMRDLNRAKDITKRFDQMNDETVWWVGQVRDEGPPMVWEFVGVFDTPQKAFEACRDESYFVSPIRMNWRAPHETTEPHIGCYPKHPHETQERIEATLKCAA